MTAPPKAPKKSKTGKLLLTITAALLGLAVAWGYLTPRQAANTQEAIEAIEAEAEPLLIEAEKARSQDDTLKPSEGR